MTDINIFKLVSMTEAELGKLTKAELLVALKKDSWMLNHHKSRVEELEKTLKENATNERAACVMLAAFVGRPLEVNEYSGEIDSKKLNILELCGLVAAKCAASAK